ncbi:MAG: hypothetical protein J6X44_13095 [Thermoguttaceae bacterium]|nr:hypothetical protein [Thermoguttaceae bacterium]
MASYSRVFSPTDKKMRRREIAAFLKKKAHGLRLSPRSARAQDDWDELIVVDASGRKVASLVFEETEYSENLREDIRDFQKIVDKLEPIANREWVKERLKETVACHLFEMFKGAYIGANFGRVGMLVDWISSKTGGISVYDGCQIRKGNGALVLGGVVLNDPVYPAAAKFLYGNGIEDEEEETNVDYVDDMDETDDVDDIDDDIDVDIDDDDDDVDPETGLRKFKAALRVGDNWKEITINNFWEFNKYLDGIV